MTKDGWIVFEGRRMRGGGAMVARVHKGGNTLYLSSAVMEKLGRPEAVVLLHRADEPDVFGVEGTEAADHRGYPVAYNGPEREGSGVVSFRAFSVARGWEEMLRDRGLEATVTMEGEMAAVDLNAEDAKPLPERARKMDVTIPEAKPKKVEEDIPF